MAYKAVPNQFAAQGGPIPLSQLDDDFNALNAKIKDPTNYGADPSGAVDSSLDMADFIAAGGGMLSSGSTFTVNASQPVDITVSSLRGRLVKWVCNNLVAPALKVFSSAAYPNNLTINSTNPIEGIAFEGNNTAGSIGVQVGHATYTGNNDIQFKNCSFFQFDTLVKFISNAWRIKFTDCLFSHCNNSGTGKFVDFGAGLTNAGEVMLFERSAFVDPIIGGAELNLVGGQWIFDDCSIGAGLVTINASSGATVLLKGCNLELQPNATVGRILKASGGASITMIGGEIILNTGGTVWTQAPIQIDDTASFSLQGTTLPAPDPTYLTLSAESIKNLITGTSPNISIISPKFPTPGVGYNFGLSSAINALYNGDASKTGLDGWAALGAGTAANSAGTGHGGSHSFHMVGAKTLTQTIPVHPGQKVAMLFWGKASGGSGTVGFPQILFYDQTVTHPIASVSTVGIPSTQTVDYCYGMVGIVPAGAGVAIALLDCQAGATLDYSGVELQVMQ